MNSLLVYSRSSLSIILYDNSLVTLPVSCITVLHPDDSSPLTSVGNRVCWEIEFITIESSY